MNWAYVAKNGEQRENNPVYYYSLDIKRIASIDLGKSHDNFIVYYINVKSFIVLDSEIKVIVECLTA